MNKRRLKITPVLVLINIVILFAMLVFYTSRLVIYYLKENKPVLDDNNQVLLLDDILKKQSYVDLNNGLVYSEKENVYRFVGKSENNYLYYSGILFRIIGIDNENNIKAISDKAITLMYSGLDKGFKDSYVNKWLNIHEKENNTGILQSNLVSSNDLLSNNYICDDKIDDIKNITCKNNTKDYKIGLLSLYEYQKIGSKNSYLNNNESFYLSSINSKNENYYVTSSGEVSLNKLNTKIHGVRPVITLNTNVSIKSGDGSLKNPYVIEKHDKKIVSDLTLGDYIKYSNNIYRVNYSDKDKVRVILNNELKIDNKEVSRSFGNNNIFSNSKNNLGQYLNSNFYDSISNNSIIIKSNWNIGVVSLDNLDYRQTSKQTVNLNIGTISLTDIFINNYRNVFTLNRALESNEIINVINKDGHIFGDFVSSKYGVVPSFYINPKTKIISGDGTFDKPYIIGESNEKNKQ